MPDNSPMDPQGLSDNSRLRASDADRDRAASVLSSAMAEGRLTAAEHSDRLDAIYAAKTQADIVPLLDDLPGHAAAVASGPASEIASRAGEHDKIVAILAGATRKGIWHPSPEITVVTIMGGVEIDLRDAVLPGREITISTLCVMGGVEITVPPEMHVVDSGTAIMGGHEVDGDTAESLQPGAPVLRVTGVCVMGGVEIKHKARKADKSRRDAISG
jgi:Domain of unknown function (DUF1707)/Cell wall-active antibiotics response 4TMS YvqF